MNRYANVYGPQTQFYPGLDKGTYVLNEGAQAVCDPKTGRIIGRFVLTGDTQARMASLPNDPVRALASLRAANPALATSLQALKVVSTVGAVASVANLGVSCVGFAIVLHRLAKIDGKLDQMMGALEALRGSVERIAVHQEALSLARMRAAGECLDRALAASSAAARTDLARRARDLFQESRFLCLELWQRADPWSQFSIDALTAVELQNRFVACALGETQAEFIGGDMGAFRHAALSIQKDYSQHMVLTAPAAIRARSDGACQAGPGALARFDVELPDLTAKLRLGQETTRWTQQRLEALAGEATLPEELSLEPHEVAQAVRSVEGDVVHFLTPP
jgi:hypothetical protein